MGRAERRVRRPLQHHVAEERVLVEAGIDRRRARRRRSGADAAAVEEQDPTYGKVYHTGNAEKVQQLLDAEGGYWYHAHPRTKSTAGFPDATWGTKNLQNDRYLGVAFKPGMGQDNSEATMCEWRCFDAVDTMNNMYAGTGIRPKFVIADIDTSRRARRTTRTQTSRSTT